MLMTFKKGMAMNSLEVVKRRIEDLERKRKRVVSDRKRATMRGKTVVVGNCDAQLHSVDDALNFNKWLLVKLEGEKK